MNQTPIRVRFAPSPTGALHIGGLRTALFDWLLARQNGGSFVLRIEDTDQKRLVPGSEAQIVSSLKWLGLDYDEGPDVGGAFGPYRQSERLDLYKKYAIQLVEKGAAYYCDCSTERLEKLRQDQQGRGVVPQYDRHCRDLNLGSGQQRVIRLKIPYTGLTTGQDIIRGTVSFENSLLDDQVLLKADGYPTYHLATPIDDYLMGITHVLRGEEWLPSLPKGLILYQALDWSPPIYIHLPLILGSDHQKLSKRHGATSVQAFIDEGYLPQALFNFLALLGWHPRGDQEVLSSEEILKQFSLDSLQKSGAVFNRKKLDWMNGVYIRKMELSEAADVAKPFVEKVIDNAYLNKIEDTIKLVRDRVKKFSELPDLLIYLHPDFDYEAELLMDKGADDKNMTIEILSQISDWLGVYPKEIQPTEIEAYLKNKVNTSGWTNKQAFWPLRVALAGLKASPGPFELMSFFGRTESQRRIRKAIDKLKT